MKSFKEFLNETEETISEAVRPNPVAEKLFEEFVSGMEKLTKKTGWGVTGNTHWDAPETITSVQYSDDPTSGDIDYDLETK